MTAEIINLRRARKGKARLKAQERAEENRARFGRSKAERETTRAEEARTTRHLEGLRRTPPESGTE